MTDLTADRRSRPPRHTRPDGHWHDTFESRPSTTSQPPVDLTATTTRFEEDLTGLGGLTVAGTTRFATASAAVATAEFTGAVFTGSRPGTDRQRHARL
ncbi:MAG: hypothetical protein R3C12_19330 [Planctomycetaceae bacterium]